MSRIRSLGLVAFFAITTLNSVAEPRFISGVYPHLTTYADNGNLTGSINECGIGAVVPWAGKLWMVNYAAHEPNGSDHKLYSIGDDLELTIHPESVGGTPAGRFIHRESNQLLIAHYLIDASGKVRVISPEIMPGRITAMARHLTDPANWIYYVDMEGMIYEANVHTLEVKKLFHKSVPGWHAKGAYTAQGRLIIANNGEHVGGSFRSGIPQPEVDAILARIEAKSPDERGVLATWDGTTWEVIERKQYTDVTGPGGLYGNARDSDPAWSIGWDERALRLKLLDDGTWHTFLLPKSSFNNDAIHGWYTEWPRIREVTEDRWMMDMHGMFFDFPATFSAANTAGLAPIGSHLRYIPDFTMWNNRLVLATDETSIQGNPRAGQPQSNLWFGTLADLKKWGPGSCYGGPWMNEPVAAHQPSLPFLVNGFTQRTLHLAVNDGQTVEFQIEIDAAGDGNWQHFKTIEVTGYLPYLFPESFQAQWIRLEANQNFIGSAYLHQTDANYRDASEGKTFFQGLANIGEPVVSGSALYTRRENRDLAVTDLKGRTTDFRKTHFTFAPGERLPPEVETHLDMTPKFYLDDASVVVESHGERLRLPKGDPAYNGPFSFGWPRTYREIQSERELANIHGTFYELPLEKNNLPPVFQKLRPISSHRKQIGDFASWNGLLVMSGVDTKAVEDPHVYRSDDGKEALWFGGIDDLWKLGKPVGIGGPWKDSLVAAETPSDPYLMTGYDKKSLRLTANQATTIRLEVNFDHQGYHAYRTFELNGQDTVEFTFPEGFSAHWVRLVSDTNCIATATFTYE
ncbi:MAG: hypothetical protein SynsKO_04270 [Synoicihabitans sp.]